MKLEELTDIMDAKAHVFRNEVYLVEGLKKIRELKTSIWEHVGNQVKEYNTNFINVMEIDSMFRIAEAVLLGAINRHKSRGAHSMAEYPKRDDKNFLKHTLVYYRNSTDEPKIAWFPVTFTRYAPVERHY
jgi:succinate dehydrogenase / fumarate reductase flavoprotein subunit